MTLRGLIRPPDAAEKSVLLVFLLCVAAILTIVLGNIYRLQPGPALMFGMPVALLTGILHHRFAQVQRFSKWTQFVIFLPLALALTAAYFVWHTGIQVDDAGFIIRYLRQTDKGCWYCFNAEEGPVFGISSFSHGVVSLLLYQLGAGSPESCLRLSNMLGFLLTAWLLMRFLELVLPWKIMVIPIAVAVLFGPKSWVVIAATGMETPLHIAIVLGALFAFAKENGKAFWFCMALAVISKLDTVPVAVIWGTLWVWKQRGQLFKLKKNPVLQALLWAGIPLALWIVFATWYFGSPLPNSAAAKVSLHRSQDQHWFPFIERYLTGEFLQKFLLAFLILWPAHILLQLFRRGSSPLSSILPGAAFVAVLALYYFYNPREKMEWYYALPDICMILQIALSAGALLNHFLKSKKQVIAFGATLLIPAFFMIDTAHGMNWFMGFLRALEGERKDIGLYVRDHTGEGDTLLAQHGMPSAFTDAFVADLTALNSRSMYKYELMVSKAVPDMKPDAVITGAFDYNIVAFSQLHYRVDTIFYEIAETRSCPWLFLVRDEKAPPFFMACLGKDEFSKVDEVSVEGNLVMMKGTEPEWKAKPSWNQPVRLRMGIRRTEQPQMVEAQQYWQDSLLSTTPFSIPVLEKTRKRSNSWADLDLPLDTVYSYREGFKVRLHAQSGDSIRFVLPNVTPK